MSSNDDQQHTSPNSEAQTRADQGTTSTHPQESNRQKLTPKNKPKKRKRKFTLEGKGTIIAAIIGAFATLTAAYLTTQTNRSQISERDKEIIRLKAEIAQLTDEINSLKHPLQEILARDGSAEFEWQWAGENWYGRVVMEQQGNGNVITQAQVGLLEKKLDDKISMAGQVFNLLPNSGNINITDDGIVHLQFSAQKKDRRSGMVRTVVIRGDLQQALCYVGKVNNMYADTNEQYPGDMVLVNPITPLDAPVENWFSANINQPWFERYIVDR